MTAIAQTVPLARVAMLATPFGFGPASKAYSIGCVLTRRYNLDVHYFGSACALDYFAAQDVPTSVLPESIADLSTEYLAMVNVLAPDLIASHQVAARTHYVDSLGFMWQAADLPPHSMLRHVRGYYVQDLFGASDNLARLGIPGVTLVSGIVASTVKPVSRLPCGPPRALVNLGGLVNPAGTESARAYLPLARKLIAELRNGPYELTVAMNRATGELGADVPVRQLSGSDFRAAMAASDVVFSSPGMTTLVEASQVSRPYVPLPPQNWSQVVIAGHMAARSDLDVWSFLTEPYRGINQNDDEMRKAAAVRNVNLRLTSDGGFATEYGFFALAAAEAAEPPAVGGPFDGAGQVAFAVAAALGVEDLES